jgi:translocation and assembly module TamA
MGVAVLGAAPALAEVTFTVTGAEGVEKTLRGVTSVDDPDKSGLDLYAEAQADYGRLTNALYGMGYYGPVIHILLDGREAATIAPLDAPETVQNVTVTVDTGPAFTFGPLRLAPLTRDTELPLGFDSGEPAYSAQISQAVSAGIDGWREAGHAKADIGAQSLVADHKAHTLSADITLAPGPVLRFGTLSVSGNKTLTEARIRAMAGVPEGRVYSASQAEAIAERLRRSGVFSSVTLSEAEGITPPDRLDLALTLVEAKPRRYTFGAEYATSDGLGVNGSWLHRNIFGGGERLEIKGAASNIDAGSSGTDYDLGVTLDRPASLGPDTALSLKANLAHTNDDDYTSNTATLGAGFTRYFTTTLTGTAGLDLTHTRGTDAAGDFRTQSLNLPISVTWDRRDSTTAPTKLFYLSGEVKPFLGFDETESGARISFDSRAYKSVGRAVLAARLQGGAILGASALGAPRDDLFYSGGGGTVRGQPYHSLGATVQRSGTTVGIGGTQFLGVSLEARVRVTQNWGVVAFTDAGAIGIDGDSAWHAGAGMGVRYETGFGPVRLDVALPVQGTTGDGPQLYVGLGQAF